MAIYKNKFKKINQPLEPRFELTKVGKGYELYHEPSGNIEKFTKLEILKIGFTPSQLKMASKNTTYFQIKRVKI